jgi:LacI family transcriptional regulator
VTGFNDMPFVDRLTPPLTTVRIQHYEMGVEAARLLLQRFARADAPGMSVRLGVQFMERGSTAAPNQEIDNRAA